MERKVVVASAQGLHARPASLFVTAAKATGAKVTIAKPGGTPANAASLLSVMGQGIKCGDEVVLVSDDAAALDTLVALLEKDLDAE